MSFWDGRIAERFWEIERLSDDAELLEAVVEGASEGLVLLCCDGLILRANRAACQFIGPDRDRIIGRPIQEVLFKGSFEAAFIAEIVASHLAVSRAYDLADGRSVLVQGRPVVAGAARVVLVISNVTSVTQLVHPDSHVLSTHPPTVLCRNRGNLPRPRRPDMLDPGGKCCARRLRRTVDSLLKASARDEWARRGQDPAMSSRQIVASSLALSVLMSSPALTWRANGQAAPPVPAGAQAPAESGESVEVTPPRVSYIYGEVSFWRPGAEDWAPARVNTPLAPGDVLYSGSGGNVEIQVGPRAFVRAAEATQIGLDNQEPDFLQLRVTGGHAALDVRELAAGHTVELGTPNAVFTVERTGFYRVGVGPDSTTFTTYRGGMATMTAAGGAPTQIAANQQVVITGTEASRVETAAAPQLTAWDRWNYERTNYLLQSTSARKDRKSTRLNSSH